MTLYFPPAEAKLVSAQGEAALFTTAPIGWILHVQVGNGSPYGHFQRLREPDRAFSHLWIAKDGRTEQYQTLDRQSWAQAGGNPRYWSVETEGYPGEPLTAAQLGMLRRWHQWTGTADRLAQAPGQAGIGYHSMGTPAQRAAGGWKPTACPGPIRVGQRSLILTGAKARAQPARRLLIVLAGMTLSGIAAQAGLDLPQVLAANPQLTNPDVIHPGDKITLPAPKAAKPPAKTVPKPKAKPVVKRLVVPPATRTRVRSGDTLSGIAAAHRLSLARLLALNPQLRARPNLIYPGQVVRIR